jgi:hypothetical protein
MHTARTYLTNSSSVNQPGQAPSLATTKGKTTMINAYNHMRYLMAQGWEFPDACFSAASAHAVAYEALADYYDEATS